ncbi:MAG TPA: sugar transferase [Armatimonadota bacterium]|jgi:lipopolysaccharide/colanic/teichoic acid biosynthesis glycosyltransferase
MRPVKSIVDGVCAALLLALCAPLFAVIAVVIKATSRGPVFFRQSRVGRGGRTFRVFKFRTMCDGAEHKGLGLEVVPDDDRITRVGHLLRNTSLDEFPQLINVLRGEMSLVGPRPTVPGQVERYTDFQRRRLEMRPGLTGWAQVNGRNSIPWDERIKLDVWYVDHWSVWLDLKVLFLTPKAVRPDRKLLYGIDDVSTHV